MYRLLVKRHRYRRRNGRRRMTQKELAQKSGISESYISHLEKEGTLRDRTPTLQTIENIAITLKICPMDLIFYPCIECPLNKKCVKKDKDMRNTDEIANEIVNYYL